MEKHSNIICGCLIVAAFCSLSTGCGGSGGSSNSTSTNHAEYRFTNLAPIVKVVDGSRAVGVTNSGLVVVAVEESNELDLVQNGQSTSIGFAGLVKINSSGSLLVQTTGGIYETVTNGVVKSLASTGVANLILAGFNAEGDVAGDTFNQVYYVHNGVPLMVNVPAGAQVNSLNDSSLMVGMEANISSLNGGSFPFTLTPSGQLTLLALPIGSSSGYANLINNADVVVGQTSGVTEWSPSGIPTLMLPVVGYGESNAYSINSHSMVVGSSSNNGAEDQTHACIFEPGKNAVDLNEAGMVTGEPSNTLLNEANSINDSGEIVGTATINGNEVAYVLTPIS